MKQSASDLADQALKQTGLKQKTYWEQLQDKLEGRRSSAADHITSLRREADKKYSAAQRQYEAAAKDGKVQGAKQWDNAQKLRERINAQLDSAEASVQDSFSSASTYLRQKWDELVAKREL